MKATDIFTPGKTPTVTLVEDHLVERRQAFTDAIEQEGMLISISGPSKSGKTVFVKSIVGSENLVAITGAGVQSVDNLWMRVFHLIGTPISRTQSGEQSSSSAQSFGGNVSGSVAVVKGQVTASSTDTTGARQASTETAAVDLLQLLIKELAGSGFVVFIDDFHYIPKELQTEVARQVKEAIDKRVLIVCASVPYHSEDVLRANSDLRGRVVWIDFDYWKQDSLTQIARKGFTELNLSVDDVTVDLMAEEAAGSPQLMQSICLNACFAAGQRERLAELTDLPNDRHFLNAVCSRTAQSADYSSTIEKLNEGPKTRGTERNQYRLVAGGVGDVYTIILKAIALTPPSLHFRYPELQDRIRRICENETPVGSSVTGACLQIALLANDGLPNTILEWESKEDVLNIRDPYLLFFMRWSENLIALEAVR